MASIIQRPTPPNEWLYKDISEEERWFTDEVCRPAGSEPWLECTQTEREEYEKSKEPISKIEENVDQNV